MVSTNENIYPVEELMISQEGQPGTHRTVDRLHGKQETRMKLARFKKRTQDLTSANKLSRLICANSC